MKRGSSAISASKGINEEILAHHIFFKQAEKITES